MDEAPVERPEHVVPLGGDQRVVLARAQVVVLEPRAPRYRQHPPCVQPGELVALARLAETLRCKLEDRLEHPEPLLAEVARSTADEALVHERGQHVEICVAHGLGRLERAPGGERGQAAKERTLGLVEQVV